MRTSPRPERARSRLGSTMVVAVFVATTAPLILAATAGAQTSTAASSSVASIRAEADKIADQYFQALSRSRDLDNDIARNVQLVDELEAKAKRARDDARARALVAYQGSATHLVTLISGHDILDAARRAHLIDSVNARDASIYARLRATSEDLRAHRRALEETRQQQAGVVAQLNEQAKAMDAKLAAADQQARAQAAAAAVVASAAPPASVPGSSAAAPAADPKPPTTSPPPKPTAPSPPPNYSGTPGTHPRHDDPFLACVRQREAGGNYGAVNPSGPYLGAYQFFQPTWNGAANHAGRSDLIGVPANLATPYDQDDVAWSLYQWQGAGPWGGACP